MFSYLNYSPNALKRGLPHYVTIAKQKQRDLTFTAQLPFNLIFFVCCGLRVIYHIEILARL
jgi:hypothetical protein